MRQSLEKLAGFSARFRPSDPNRQRGRVPSLSRAPCDFRPHLLISEYIVPDMAVRRNPALVLAVREARCSAARIILQPPDRRRLGLAQRLSDPFDFPQHPERVRRRHLFQIAIGKPAAHEFGEQVGKAADVFEADRGSAAEIVRSDSRRDRRRPSRPGARCDRRPVRGSLWAQSRASPRSRRTALSDRPQAAPCRRRRASAAASRAAAATRNPARRSP